MKKDMPANLPLPLELTEPEAMASDLVTMLGESHEHHKRSNSQCVNYGLIQIDDVQIDNVDLF